MRPFSSEHLIFAPEGFELLAQPSLQIEPDLFGVSVIDGANGVDGADVVVDVVLLLLLMMVSMLMLLIAFCFRIVRLGILACFLPWHGTVFRTATTNLREHGRTYYVTMMCGWRLIKKPSSKQPVAGAASVCSCSSNFFIRPENNSRSAFLVE